MNLRQKIRLMKEKEESWRRDEGKIGENCEWGNRFDDREIKKRV